MKRCASATNSLKPQTMSTLSKEWTDQDMANFLLWVHYNFLKLLFNGKWQDYDTGKAYSSQEVFELWQKLQIPSLPIITVSNE